MAGSAVFLTPTRVFLLYRLEKPGNGRCRQRVSGWQKQHSAQYSLMEAWHSKYCFARFKIGHTPRKFPVSVDGHLPHHRISLRVKGILIPFHVL